MEVGVIQIRSQDGIGRGWWFISRGVGAIRGGVYSRTIILILRGWWLISRGVGAISGGVYSRTIILILRRSRDKDRRGGLIGRGGGFIGGSGSIGRGGLEITRTCTRWHERITIWRPHKHLWA
jgi:hypothetical protein